MNELTKQEINAIARHLAYEIVEQESDVVSDPKTLEEFIEKTLIEYLKPLNAEKLKSSIDGMSQMADNADSAGFTPQTDRTLRDYFELELFRDVRQKAFKITPKSKLDMYIGTLSKQPFQLALTVDDNIFDRAYYEKHFDAESLKVFDTTKIGDTIDGEFKGKPWLVIRIL